MTLTRRGFLTLPLAAALGNKAIAQHQWDPHQYDFKNQHKPFKDMKTLAEILAGEMREPGLRAARDVIWPESSNDLIPYRNTHRSVDEIVAREEAQHFHIVPVRPENFYLYSLRPIEASGVKTLPVVGTKEHDEYMKAKILAPQISHLAYDPLTEHAFFVPFDPAKIKQKFLPFLKKDVKEPVFGFVQDVERSTYREIFLNDFVPTAAIHLALRRYIGDDHEVSTWYGDMTRKTYGTSLFERDPVDRANPSKVLSHVSGAVPPMSQNGRVVAAFLAGLGYLVKSRVASRTQETHLLYEESLGSEINAASEQLPNWRNPTEDTLYMASLIDNFSNRVDKDFSEKQSAEQPNERLRYVVKEFLEYARRNNAEEHALGLAYLDHKFPGQLLLHLQRQLKTNYVAEPKSTVDDRIVRL